MSSNPDRVLRASERYCIPCRAWYEGSLHACPECATPKPAFNKSLRVSALNNHLYSQAASAR